MAKVGDFFPEDKKREVAARKLTAGRVLYLHCTFTRPPKEKFVVVAAAASSPMLLVVNSEISKYIEHRAYLKEVQVTLKATDYGFLRHDSFLDCSEVISSVGSEEIIEQIVADFSRVKGELGAAERALVLEAVRKARTVSPAHKRSILTELK